MNVSQVVLSVRGGRLTCTALKGGNIIFDSGVCDCVHHFPLEDRNSRNNFVLIVRANEIYLHCRLFSASSAPQVSNLLRTLKSDTPSHAQGAFGIYLNMARSYQVTDSEHLAQTLLTTF
jgi:hypothetical protein